MTALGFALASLALLLATGWLLQKHAERRDARRYPPPGRMVDMGTHRLHLVHKGASRGPTVVIEQGAGGPAFLWWPVLDRVAAFAGVCAHDRAGNGASESPPAPHTPLESAHELHSMLVHAGIPGPYILVGHSYGGLIVRLFARDHREDVAGLVLVDTIEEGAHFQPDVLKLYARFVALLAALELAARFGVQRLLGLVRRDDDATLPPELRGRMAAASRSPGFFRAMRTDMSALAQWDVALRHPGATGTLDDVPLLVVTHGQPFPGAFAVLEKYWAQGQRRLAELSTNSELIVARGSNHMVQNDEPDLIVEAIHRVYVSATTGARIATAA
jgi:pimeloyl-ACP methyl ester carboxylesterase